METEAARAGFFDHLREHSLGLPQVLFQSITYMAPDAAVAFSLLVSVQYAAPALRLSVLLALVGFLLLASSIGQLAKPIPSRRWALQLPSTSLASNSSGSAFVSKSFERWIPWAVARDLAAAGRRFTKSLSMEPFMELSGPERDPVRRWWSSVGGRRGASEG